MKFIKFIFFTVVFLNLKAVELFPVDIEPIIPLRDIPQAIKLHYGVHTLDGKETVVNLAELEAGFQDPNRPTLVVK